jgi:hypothetical protein
MIVPSAAPLINDPSFVNFPTDYLQVPDVTPFTERSAMSYTALLESMRSWLLDTLTPYLSLSFGSLTGEWETQVTDLITAVNTALSTQQSAINSAWDAEKLNIASLAQDAINASAQQLLSSTSASTDPAIMAVLNNTSSTTRIFFDTTYAKKDPASLDASVKAALQVTGSTALALLDTRYASTFSDASLATIIENAASTTRKFMDGLYLIDATASVDPAVLSALQVTNSQTLAWLTTHYEGIFDTRYQLPDAVHMDPSMTAAYNMQNGTFAAAAQTKNDARYPLATPATITDANTVTKSGYYTGTNINNAPTNEQYVITATVVDVNTQTQLAQNISSGGYYRRRKTSGNWQSWVALQDNVDTGWSISAITGTSGWNGFTDPEGVSSGAGLNGGLRVKNGLLMGSFLATYIGSTTLTSDSYSNIADQLVCYAGVGFRPSADRFFDWYIPGYSKGSGKIMASDGSIWIQSLDGNGNTIHTGNKILFDFVKPV